MVNGVLQKGRAAGGWASLITDDLERVERILRQSVAPQRASFGSLVDQVQLYRGKRLRPTLLLLVAGACGKIAPAHHTLAAVVEMIHTATLVHDDVLDEASTRRHSRTINSGWGNKVGILLGDWLFTNAFYLSSTLGDARACEWIGEATNRVCAGELRQTLERGNLDLSEDAYFAIIDGKTAALTECCGRLGASFAGADPEQVEKLACFGRDLGLAFQIADDVLDLIGDERTAGKTLGTDLAQRKLTLPLIEMLERVEPADAKRFRLLLGERSGQVGELQKAVRETGALEAAQFRAEDLAERAREQLQDLPLSPFRTALEGIATWAVRREA